MTDFSYYKSYKVMTSNVVHIVFNAKWMAKSRASYDSTPTSPISVSAKKAGTAKPNDGLKKFCFWVHYKNWIPETLIIGMVF